MQGEVDGCIAHHRRSPVQSPGDVLAGLSLEEWEAEFPLVDLCLRESIRLQTVGTVFRKNLSGADVAIGTSGETVPRDAFAVYLLDEVHMDPSVYRDPARWDPGRYLPGRAEDKAAPLAYLGWGTGRHPCLGMRFAKLEVAIITAIFVSMFNFELVDTTGKRMEEAPLANRDKHSASKPDVPVRLRYTARR